MKILAMESADGACSVAYADGEQLELLRNTQIRDSLSWMREQVEELRLRHFQHWQALDGLACCIGPGGFTGVRVAVGYAQGLGLAGGLPILGVSSLDAMASAAEAKSDAQAVWIALDARMGELYAARYQRRDGRLLRDGDMVLCTPERLADSLQGGEELWGPGFVAHAPHFSDAVIRALDLDAAAVSRFARRQGAPQLWSDAEALQPIYLRNQVAQTIAEREAARQAKA